MIPDKVYMKTNKVEDYINIVNELFDKVKAGLIVKYSAPFVLFCGTSLEYMLNDLFIEHASIYFPGKCQKKFSESFISMNFNAKLTCALPIITNHRFQIDLNSTEYKVLCELISLRNQIAHGKDFYRGLDPQNIKEDGTFSIVIDKDELNKTNPLNISLPEAEKFKKTIENFYINIYLPYINGSLRTNNFVINVKKSNNRKGAIEFK